MSHIDHSKLELNKKNLIYWCAYLQSDKNQTFNSFLFFWLSCESDWYAVYPGVFYACLKICGKGDIVYNFFHLRQWFFWQIKRFLISSNSGYYFCLLNTCILRCKNDIEIKRKLDHCENYWIWYMYLTIVSLILALISFKYAACL